MLRMCEYKFCNQYHNLLLSIFFFPWNFPRSEAFSSNSMCHIHWPSGHQCSAGTKLDTIYFSKNKYLYRLRQISNPLVSHSRSCPNRQNCVLNSMVKGLVEVSKSQLLACSVVLTSTASCRVALQPLRSRTVISRQGSQSQRERKMNRKFWALYVSHLLSTWSDKMWEFSVPFFLLGLDRPNTMSFVGLYALAAGATNIAFGPVIGYLVDKYPRLQTLIFTLLLQNILISVSFLLLYSILSLSTASGTFGAIMMSGVIILCACASLASTARYILLP